MSSSAAPPVIEKKRFENPDQRKTPHETASVDILNFSGAPGLRHVVAKPGWQWSTCSQSASRSQTACQSSHVGVMQKGAS